MGISPNPAQTPNTVDTDYDLFWREVIDCVKHVELNHGLSYVVERGTRSARVSWTVDEQEFGSGIEIFILEIEPKQPALLVP